MKNLYLLTFAALFFQTSLGYSATQKTEHLLVPIMQQGDKNLDVPKNGLTKDKVIEQFGQPSKINSAVGNPPISNWEYPHFYVYFEGDRVLHSVLKK